MWSKILGFILDKDNRQFILIGALVLAIVFGVSQCDRKQYYKSQEQKQINNIEALTDTLGFYENKAGELTAEKQALETDIKQLETLNDSLYTEVQKEKDKVEQITAINATLSSDTLRADTVEVFNPAVDQWRFNWSFEQEGTGWSKIIQGFTHFHIDNSGIPKNPTSILTKDELILQLITGITERNGRKQIFVRSNYPNLTVTNIQGAILEDRPIFEKPSRFGIGVSTGYGINTNGEVAPTIGLTLNYNLIRF